MSADLQLVLAGLVDELANRRRVVERIPYWDGSRNRKYRDHAVNLPPLLEALALAAYPAGRTSDDQDPVRRPPGSRPPVNLDAIDRFLAIRLGATRWLNRLDLPGRAVLADDLRQLLGAAGRMASGDLQVLVAEVGTWKVWAEVACGERGTSWTPDAPCPCCDRRNSVRVRADAKRAFCSRCEAVWDEASIGILARHVEAWSTQRDLKDAR